MNPWELASKLAALAGRNGKSDPVCIPAAVSATNCADVLGLSWSFVRRFADQHGVEVVRVGPRSVIIPLPPLLVAMAQHSAEHAPREPTEAEQDAMYAERYGYRVVR